MIDQKFNDKDKELIFQQWQICVEMANSISERRDKANNLFVTLNLAIVAAASAIWDREVIFLLASGIAACAIWIFYILSFKKLNEAKFKVINDMEKHLPVHAFDEEWNILKGSKYVQATYIEVILAGSFIVIYAIAISLIIFR